VSDIGQIRIIGAGLAGLVAAITAAEDGASVEVLEAHSQLGGRARSTDGPFVANFGPHALYKGLSNWNWLKQRGLLGELATPRSSGVRFYLDGRARRTPPLGLIRSLPLAFASAPSDRDFRSWASSEVGERNAAMLCGYGGVITFHPDPGSLSAAFLAERFRWVYVPPGVRFVKGGWSELIARLHERASQLGVEFQMGVRVSELPDPPVIVATELHEARRLLGDETLRCEGATAALLDLGLRSREGDPGAVVDLEQGALIERYSSCDETVAPRGCEIVQAHIGIDGAAEADRGVLRLEEILDQTFTGWRERVLWRRRQISVNRTGAVDLPGHSWIDRPAIDRGEGVFLAGDMVRAPGFLSEVSFLSGQQAAHAAVSWQSGAPQPTRSAPLHQTISS
jgi:NAD(P)-binding Rossmann-like domain